MGGYRGGSSIMGPRSDRSVAMRSSAKKQSVAGYGKKARKVRNKQKAQEAAERASLKAKSVLEAPKPAPPKTQGEIKDTMTRLADVLVAIDWADLGRK